jgi:hypothetical protein
MAQPEQEPVAWGVFDGPNLHDMFFAEEDAKDMARLKGVSSVVKPLYTTQPAAQHQAAERNKLASWMIAQGYATGHGDSMEGLLEELEQEIGFDRAELCELWIKRINKAVLAEREQCAKLCDQMEQEAEGTECCKWPTPADCAHAIRSRGQA